MFIKEEIEKKKMKPQFCFHFNLKHGFWDCIGYDSMKMSTLLSIEDPDNYSFSTKILIQLPMLINALLFIKSRGFSRQRFMMRIVSLKIQPLNSKVKTFELLCD